MKPEPDPVSRRDLFRRAALGAAGAALLPGVPSGAQEPQPQRPRNPYRPFKMGLQSYSLRKFPLADALAKTKALGLTWWEAWNGHMNADMGKVEEYKKLLAEHGVRVQAYGVVDFDGDEAKARKLFDFARAMGIETLSASPQPAALPLLDKLTQEYKVNIAIHNHGPGDEKYDLFEKVLAAVEKYNVRVGACCDTGHLLRSEQSPVTAFARYGDRLHGVHWKNVLKKDGKMEFTEIGATGGLLDEVNALKKLREIKYNGVLALEYEEHEDAPVPYIEKCLEATRRYARQARGAQG